MVEILKELGFSVGMATVIGGALGFLIKTWIDHGRSIELEELKSQLSVLQNERTTKFNRLHQDQAEAIKAIYSLIHEHRMSIAVFLRSLSNSVDKKEWESYLMDVFDKSIALYDFHMKNRILFSKEVNALIDKIEHQQHSIPTPFFPDVNSPYAVPDRPFTDSELTATFFQRYKEASEQLDSGFESLMEELDSAFRKILGI